MKIQFRPILTALAVIFLTAPPAFSQNFSIDWHKIAGGGGTGTGGTYQVNGTIGQHDASGAMTSSQYAITGGFWSLINVVQTPGAPLLTINYVASQYVVAWPASVAGWTLQTNVDLAASAWGDYLGPVFNNRVTNSTPFGNLFFRLKQ